MAAPHQMPMFNGGWPAGTNPWDGAYEGWYPCGNWDGPLGHVHDAGQPYAWDWGYSQEGANDDLYPTYDPTGANYGVIYAARAGRVIFTRTGVTGATPGGGNVVVLRHCDGTTTAYCHMKANSVMVTVDQYVLRSQGLGVAGNTGAASCIHLHFERSAWARPENPNLTTYTFPQGLSIESHFESPGSYVAEPWRPLGTQTPSAYLGVTAQDGWRFCTKCACIYYSEVTVDAFGKITGRTVGVCQGGSGGHSSNSFGNYTVLVGGSAGQPNWRYCTKCCALFFGGSGATRCPVTSPTNQHTPSTTNYRILSGPGSSDQQHGWRWCVNCQSLFHASAANSKCPIAGSPAHSAGSGTDYYLHLSTDDVQQGWRWCSHCCGLFFRAMTSSDYEATPANVSAGVCSRSGHGAHESPYRPYLLYHSVSPINGGGGGQTSSWQQNWAWCSSCQVLFYGPNQATSDCPATGTTHTNGGTNYFLLQTSNAALGQTGWDRCIKCHGLFFVPTGGTSICPAGTTHSGVGANYTIAQDSIGMIEIV